MGDYLLLAATIFTASIASFYVLWVLFLAVMNLQRASKAGLLTPLAKALGTPILIVGWVLDFLLNITVMVVICLEMPKESTISSRLKRYNRDPNEWAWRRKVAAFFEPLLDPYDYRGDHI